MKRILTIAGLIAISACATTPASDIAIAEASLAAADTAALAYVKLPACAASLPATTLCKKPDVVVQIGKASSSAYIAVKAAEIAQTQAAIQQAQTAIAALQSIIATVTGG